MSSCQTEFERIRTVLERADASRPLTASEIRAVLEEHGQEIDSSHRVATVLGRQAQTGAVRVIEDNPYRYRITE